MKRLILFCLTMITLPAAFASASLADPKSGNGYFPQQPGHAGPGLIICQYRSRAGNCFRLLRGTGILVPLHSETSFRQFTSELLLHADQLAICEISERWSPWTAFASTGGAPAEQRFCSPGPTTDAPACPCRALRQTRSVNTQNQSQETQARQSR